ncbi:MAG: hypothetical protein WBD10_00545 [Acidobacteriaceae bacterium]
MSVSDLDHLLWLAGDAGQLLLLAILIVRRLHRLFPLFSIYLSWQLVSDLLLFLALTGTDGYLKHHYVPIYYSLNIATYLFELAVLLEIGGHVLRPAKRVLPRGVLYFLLGAVGLAFVACFFLVEWLKPTPLTNLRVFLVADSTSAIMCLIAFLLIAGFSQVLGLNWKNHVLQLATGLAFYAVVDLLTQIMLSQLPAGPSYASSYYLWSRVGVIGYLCTVSFWCYAFVKKEAPRQEFSPQMQKFLVLLSSGAKRQRAVFARSREN